MRLDFEEIIIPPKNWIDIQDLVKIPGYSRAGMDTLENYIIDRSYGEMKNNFPTDRHNFWEERPLDDLNLKYAAIDAYVSYEMYVHISFFLGNLVVPRKTFVCQGCRRDASEIAMQEEAATRHRTWDAEPAAKRAAWDAVGTSSPPSKWDLLAAEQEWQKGNTTSTWNDQSWGSSKRLKWNDEQ